MTHYVPTRNADGTWFGFSSPIGRHESQWTFEKCVEIIEKVRAEHVLRSQGEGHEASLLADYFENEGREPAPVAPRKAMEEYPCTGRQKLHDWTYNETTGIWSCSACGTDKRDFDRALRERSLHMMRENRKRQTFR